MLIRNRFPEDRLVVITDEENVSVSSDHTMPNCNHEEADTRLLAHVADALQRGSKEVSVRTVDTDVVVILIGHFYNLMRKTRYTFKAPLLQHARRAVHQASIWSSIECLQTVPPPDSFAMAENRDVLEASVVHLTRSV
ncbi:hypothetical protein AC249_AIPGENE29235 [Exaiptasia diaphana]|nr:hypothetical protein AC249_AIPGENE29235 [Exaiptasia diaphana]